MGFQDGFAYSSFISHALEDKSQTSLLSDIDASSDGDLSLCGERGDSPAALSAQGSLDSNSHQAEDGLNEPLSPTLESHKATRHRTAQACDKCRERKTKCSGNRPVCNRCGSRGLICEYSVRESRIRTPIRTRPPPPMSSPNPLQVNYHDTIRPTPAYHSRMGHGQSQAFAPAPYPRIMSPHSPAPSSSYSSGISSEKGTRLDISRERPVPLGLGISPGGRLAAAQPSSGMSTWDIHLDTSRPHSAPVTLRYVPRPGVSSHGSKMEANLPEPQDLGDRSAASYSYEHGAKGGQMAIPSIRIEESPYRHSPLDVSTATRESSSQWYKNIDNSSLTVPRPLHDGRPASLPTMPSTQHSTQAYPKSYESHYDSSLYQANFLPFEDWTGPSGMESEHPLPEATSILAAHYDRLGSMDPDNVGFGTDERMAMSGATQVSSLEAVCACPAPLLPIGAGVFGLPSSLSPMVDRPTTSYDARDAFQQQQGAPFDAIYTQFAHDPNGCDVGVNTHRDIQQPHPHAAGRHPQHPDDVAFVPIAGHNDFNEYDFL